MFGHGFIFLQNYYENTICQTFSIKFSEKTFFLFMVIKSSLLKLSLQNKNVFFITALLFSFKLYSHMFEHSCFKLVRIQLKQYNLKHNLYFYLYEKHSIFHTLVVLMNLSY